MAQLIITDAPGDVGEAYVCPFCGRMVLTKRLDDQGIPTQQDAEPPRNCVRCGSPMDTDGDAAQKFQDAKAAEGMKLAPRGARRTVKV